MWKKESFRERKRSLSGSGKGVFPGAEKVSFRERKKGVFPGAEKRCLSGNGKKVSFRKRKNS
jgi:hypothetical protein